MRNDIPYLCERF